MLAFCLQGYLGLGSVLYLNFMRWMSIMFFVIGMFTVPNAYHNSFGDRCVTVLLAVLRLLLACNDRN